MAAELLTIEGQLWVAGLQWRVHEEMPSRQALGVTAAGMAADWIVQRREGSLFQSGFCEATERASARKVAALAPAVAGLYPAPWIGIYQIEEDSFWFVAIGDGNAVLAEGDFIGTAIEVNARRLKFESVDQWTVQEGDQEALFALLRQAKRDASTLTAVSERPAWLLPAALVGCLAVVAGYAGYSHLMALHRQHEQEAQNAELQRQAALRRSVSPVAGIPLPETWLDACEDLIGPTPISQDGWRLGDWACEHDRLTLSWVRGAGATVAIRPQGDITINGDKVEQHLPLPHLRDRGNSTLPSNSTVPAFLALAQASEADPRITSASAVLGAGPQAVMGLRQGGWTHFTLDMPVTPLGVRWDSVWGLRFTALSRRPGNYHLEGDIYER